MTKIVLTLFTLTLFSSCMTTKVIPIKGSYLEPPYQISTGKTVINVNIVNVKYETYDIYRKSNKDVILTEYKSTGVFEKLIADIIK